MSELERIKNIEERIALAGLLPGVNLGFLPMEDAAKAPEQVHPAEPDKVPVPANRAPEPGAQKPAGDGSAAN